MMAALCITAPSLAMFGPGFTRGFGPYGCGPYGGGSYGYGPYGPWGGFPGYGPYDYGGPAPYGCGYGGYPAYDNLNMGNEGLDICISLPGIGSISMGQLASGLSATSIG